MKFQAAFLLLIGLFLGTGCGFIKGSGNLVTVEKDIKEFNRVEISSAFKAELIQGNRFEVKLEVDDNLQEHLRVEKEGDTLKIGLVPFAMYMGTTTRVRIVMPRLRGLDISGAVKASLDGFCSGDEFDLRASGASEISFHKFLSGKSNFRLSGASNMNGKLDVGDLDIHLSGASEVKVSGTGKNIALRGSGASSIDLKGLANNNTKVHLSGASHANISTKGQLDIELSGASSLVYSGKPTLGIVKSSGASSVKRDTE